MVKWEKGRTHEARHHVMLRQQIFRPDIERMDRATLEEGIAAGIHGVTGDGQQSHGARLWAALSWALDDVASRAPQLPRDKRKERWNDIGYMVSVRNACCVPPERHALTRDISRQRRTLKRAKAKAGLRSSV